MEYRYIIGIVVVIIVFVLLFIFMKDDTTEEEEDECTQNSDCGTNKTYRCISGQCKSVQCLTNLDCGDKQQVCNRNNRCEERNRSFYLNSLSFNSSNQAVFDVKCHNGFFNNELYIAQIDIKDETNTAQYPAINVITPVIYNQTIGTSCSITVLDWLVINNKTPADTVTWSTSNVTTYNNASGSKFKAYSFLYDTECATTSDCTNVSDTTNRLGYCDTTKVSNVANYPYVCTSTVTPQNPPTAPRPPPKGTIPER